jgi:hypothetical protein
MGKLDTIGISWGKFDDPYPLVITLILCELEAMAQAKSLIQPAIKWWICP